MDNPNFESPFNALPRSVLALAAVMFGIEVLFQLATLGILGGQEGVGWRLNAIRDWGVFDAVAADMWRLGVYPPEHMARFLTYPLLHGSFIHAGFVCVFVLTLGKLVAEAFSAWAFWLIFVCASLIGALAFVVLLDPQGPLVGGYPGTFGLIGAYTFIVWVRATALGQNQYRAFALVGVLLALQLVLSAIQGDFGNVTADFAGFLAGFALSFLVVPGGWARVLDLLRRR